MYCWKCGNKLVIEGAFCQSCGTSNSIQSSDSEQNETLNVDANEFSEPLQTIEKTKRKKFFRQIFLVSVGLILFLLFGYCMWQLVSSPRQSPDSVISAEEYEQIEEGMDRNKVSYIVGNRGVVFEESDGFTSVVYEGEKKGTSVMVIFKNGKVIAKRLF